MEADSQQGVMESEQLALIQSVHYFFIKTFKLYFFPKPHAVAQEHFCAIICS